MTTIWLPKREHPSRREKSVVQGEATRPSEDVVTQRMEFSARKSCVKKVGEPRTSRRQFVAAPRNGRWIREADYKALSLDGKDRLWYLPLSKPCEPWTMIKSPPENRYTTVLSRSRLCCRIPAPAETVEPFLAQP